MSFADEVREELLDLQIKSACCRRAFICGLLLNADVKINAEKEREVIFYQSSDRAADICPALIKQQFGRDCKTEKLIRSGRPTHRISFESRSAADILDKLSGLGEKEIDDIIGFKCQGCVGAFLRGVFCGCGTLADPKKYYHLEFHINDSSRCERLCRIISAQGIEPLRSTLKSGYRVYFKSGQSIDDMLTLMGAQQKLFDLLNAHIEREIRNNENRVTNCLATNIQKTVSAAGRQINAIKKLMDSPKYASVPDELKETAELRIKYAEISLAELAAAHTVPITKSGLNHRLEKLVRMSEDISEK